MMRGTGILATIGATAPFVGLFGTVWGIMNSFIGISKLHTTNLAVVAPGIAEALLATAFGLAAAIPAVVIYNMFARSIAQYRALYADASVEIMTLVSRDLVAAAVEDGATRPRWRRGGVRPMSIRLDHGEDSLGDIHEINVTPFIDVILVLLIIFMIAAPLATVDVRGRPADVQCASGSRGRTSRSSSPSNPTYAVARRRAGLARRACSRPSMARRTTAPSASSCAPTRQCPMAADGRHEPAAQLRLSQGRAGRSGVDAAQGPRWHIGGSTAPRSVALGLCFAAVLAHGRPRSCVDAVAEASEFDAGAAVVLLELPDTPAAPMTPPNDLTPGRPSRRASRRRAQGERPSLPKRKRKWRCRSRNRPSRRRRPRRGRRRRCPRSRCRRSPRCRRRAPRWTPAPDVKRWESALVAHIERFKRYPAEARAHDERGTARVAFTIDHDGLGAGRAASFKARALRARRRDARHAHPRAADAAAAGNARRAACRSSSRFASTSGKRHQASVSLTAHACRRERHPCVDNGAAGYQISTPARFATWALSPTAMMWNKTAGALKLYAPAASVFPLAKTA